MQKIFLWLVALFVIMFIGIHLVSPARQDKKTNKNNSIVQQPTISLSPKATNNSSMIFVPYWSVTGKTLDDASYDTAVYFGVTGGLNGIAKDDGYARIDSFISSSQSKRKLLTVRMLDSDVDSKVLADPSLQKKIITESLALAKAKGFDGVVLDLEISAIAFDSLVSQIRTFAKDYTALSHASSEQFYMTVYGDTYYRSRPFDISSIAKNTDGIFIMAYDFHKARGNPGPNFPLAGYDTYGYDIKHMTDDFLSHASTDKITIIFGMFGYDWTLDSSHQSTDIAKPLSLYQIKQTFIDSCSFSSCKITRDSNSAETIVRYKDTAGKDHEVWFEDTESIKKKKEYLKTKGITSFGFWAYSYF